MLVSDGVLVKGVIWEGTTAQFDTMPGGLQLSLRFSSYSTLYREQLWVAVVVNKRAGMVSRLPLVVYRRTEDDSRARAPESAYAKLLARPNDRHDPVLFWKWTSSTYDIFGEAFWGKVRDRGGRPVQLVPLHPTKMHLELDGTWTYQSGTAEVTGIQRRDLVHFQDYNPDSLDRGMSRLEPLRRTLENEDAARRATSSFWRRGARPGVALLHQKNISQPAADRLRAQWDDLAAGADNTGRSVVLEEGMKPEVMQLTAEESQYIETRKLNREEVVAAYDMPPPAVHILDHATFSNITEQFRSVYRDTMAPVLGGFEATVETQLRRDDFGDEVYAEFLMDEVLRGSFEARQEAYKNADYMTVAEKRRLENLPFMEGTDRIVLNGAAIPLDMIDEATAARGGSSPEPAARGVTSAELRSVMGRLSRGVTNAADVDPLALTDGLVDPRPVLAVLSAARSAGDDLAGLKTRLRALTED